MRFPFILLAMMVGFGFCTSGCATAVAGYPESSLDLAAEQKVLAPYLNPNVIEVIDTKPPAERRAYRDKVIEARLRDIDLRFAEFERSLYAQGIGFGVGTDWAIVVANAYGALSDNSARSMAVVASALTGGKGAVDKNAFYDKTLPVLMAQMAARRKTVLVTIRQAQQGDETQYPLLRAFSDIQDYADAGSIPGALAGISESVGTENKKATQDLKDLQVEAKITPKPERTARKQKLNRYIQALDANRISQIYMTLPPEYRRESSTSLEDRKAAIKDAVADATLDQPDEAKLDALIKQMGLEGKGL